MICFPLGKIISPSISIFSLPIAVCVWLSLRWLSFLTMHISMSIGIILVQFMLFRLNGKILTYTHRQHYSNWEFWIYLFSNMYVYMYECMYEFGFTIECLLHLLWLKVFLSIVVLAGNCGLLDSTEYLFRLCWILESPLRSRILF